MASVTFDVPGVGKVVAENAASEETLHKILAAVQKSEKSKREEEKKATDALKKAKEAEAAAAGKTTEALEDLGDAAKNTKKTQTESEKVRAEAAKKYGEDIKATGVALGQFGGSLAKTAISLTAQFATAYEAMAEKPISAMAGILNTSADLIGQGAKVVVDGTGAVAKGLLGIIPGASGAIDGFAGAAKGAIDLGVALSKVVNDVLAKEFNKSTDALRSFTKSGASFAGGMLEMRNVANQSGVTLDVFTKIVAQSSDAIRTAGLTQADGARAISAGMAKAADITTKGGRSLRDEMLAMGYSYEEQGAMMAQVMATDRAAGNTRKMSSEELASTTRAYAKDLKVLADITGKDAKKAMEEAAKKSMEADIMAQLKPEEAAKFQKAYAAMPDYAKKGFLEYVSTGGQAITDQATNIAMVQNKEFEQLIKGTYDNIKNDQMDASSVQKETLKQTAVAGQAQREYNKTQGAAIGMVTRLTGGLAGTSDILNGLSADAVKSADAVEESGKAADGQASSTDKMTDAFIAATGATTKMAVEMQTLATDALPMYAGMIKKAAETAEKAFMIGAKVVSGEMSPTEALKAMGGPESKEEQAARAATKEWAAAAPGTRTESGMDFNMFASGGVALPSPNSINIAGEKQPEAVVPLPDGRTIPVQMQGAGIDLSGLLSAVAEQTAKLEQITRILADNRDYTERLMHNMS